ncbi:MAG TPA: hypothetical protein VNX65_01470 [Patescibacteria group bacterium]|jgi:hypothetical protein|nr:hypothetical protein [Patescibacteria group bacterium]
MANTENLPQGDKESGLTGEAIPTRYPRLPNDAINTIYEEWQRLRDVRAGDMMRFEMGWQIEQRLGAINDARENSSLSPEEADRLELEALRKLREVTFESGAAIPMEVAHRAAQSKGLPPVNVTKPGYVEKLDF